MEHSAQRKSLKQKTFFSLARVAAGLQDWEAFEILSGLPFSTGRKRKLFYPDRAKKIPAKTIKAPQT